MHLTFRNCNDAFRELVGLIHRKDTGTATLNRYGLADCTVVRRPSRNGDVFVINEPVTITYTHPRERVLFNAVRDANPFALLYEALWMLAGRNDVESLTYYTKQFAEYSDDGATLNGAYGYRWRSKHYVQNWVGGYDAPQDWGKVDQLDILVTHLKADPTSRRAVLQMWNVEDDLLKIGGYGNRIQCPNCHGTGFVPDRNSMDDCTIDCPRCKRTCWVNEPASKDVCCNLSVMFSLRMGEKWPDAPPGQGPTWPFLDMTVTNRSNDLVWGLLGANYVCFSILQEYMAARLGAEVGRYHHFSNNLHAYDGDGKKTARWEPEKWLAWETSTEGVLCAQKRVYITDHCVPLVKDPEAFERELPRFVDVHADGAKVFTPTEWTEPFLNDVAEPMMMAFHSYKRRAAATNVWAGRIKADDWRVACRGWLERRLNRVPAG